MTSEDWRSAAPNLEVFPGLFWCHQQMGILNPGERLGIAQRLLQRDMRYPETLAAFEHPRRHHALHGPICLRYLIVRTVDQRQALVSLLICHHIWKEEAILIVADAQID